MPKNPKDQLLKLFEGKHAIRKIFGQSFYELNSISVLYFRFSKAHKKAKNIQFFFGVESDDLHKFKNKNLFILFICESEDEIIVIPIEDFLEMVGGSEPVSNQWKISIFKGNGKYALQIAGKGKYDVTMNLNQFDFRPKEFRSIQLPSIGIFTPTGRKREPKESEMKPQFSEQLEDRLLASSTNSRSPIIFEKTVGEVFEKLGFKVRHLGGPGKTDILVESPIRGIIDCKSTAGDSCTHINFARIKRHKQENNGSFILVVSVGFDPAVVRDAESEQVALMPAEALKELLVITRNYTFSPFEIDYLLRKAGLIENADLDHLRNKEKHYRDRINAILRVIKNLDFKERDLKEIKGRLSYEAEEKHHTEIKEEELNEILQILSSPLLSIVENKNGAYSLRFSYVQSIDKIKNLLKHIIAPET